MIDILIKQTKKNPDKTIIVFKNRFISYKKFNYMVNNAMPNIIQNDSNYIGIQIKNKLKLLVAIIAAIAINMSDRERALRQDPAKQILETKKSRLKIIKDNEI